MRALTKNLPHRSLVVYPQLIKTLLPTSVLVSFLFLVAPAQAADNQVDLPSPFDIITTAALAPAIVAPQEQAEIDIPSPEAMRFISLGRVSFDSNKWELSDAAKRSLDDMSAFLTSNPGASRLLLDGYTDSVGGARFNDTLSDKRAMAVKTYLASKGIDPELIFLKGYGERSPTDQNWTRLGRDRNRQVELFAIFPAHP
jgi:outer membrane protein OmpA-like peptidoglycan-associated protein